MADAPVIQSAPAPAPFTFIQEHGAFFGLYIKTLLLTGLTFGIYSFWGRVAITRFLYSHTSFGNNSFDYHATGKEMFIGFLKGMGIVAVVVAVVGIIGKFFPFLNIVVNSLLAIGIVFYLAPYIMVGQWRFWLSRSSYCNVRFSHRGDFAGLRSIWIPGMLLTMVTLGLYWPVLQNRIQKYYTDNNRFGTLAFAYSGDNKEFFWLWIKGVIFTVLSLGLYSFWFTAKMNRYIFAHTTFNGKKFDCTMAGGDLFVLSITNLLIVIFTLTLGFPIAANRMYGYFWSTITLAVDPRDIATAAASMDTGASALAQGIEDAASVVDAVSGLIG